MMVGQVTINVAGGTGAATDNGAAARAIAGNNIRQVNYRTRCKCILPGSRVECVCDVDTWVVTGFILAATADVTAVFGDQ